MANIYRMLASDYDNQQRDAQLYPGRASDDLLKKVPPFALWTSEFDFLRRDSLALAERGKKLGKLLDISDIPGVMHAHMGCSAVSQECQWLDDEQTRAFDVWIRGKK